MLVRELMSSPVVAVTATMSVAETAAVLAEHGFTAVPVVGAGGRLVGIVTETDLVRVGFPRDPRPATGPDDGVMVTPGPKTVGEVMQRAVVTVTADTEITEVVELMLRLRTRSLPVCRGEQVVGMVTRHDLVRALTPARFPDLPVRQWLLALAALPPMGDRAAPSC